MLPSTPSRLAELLCFTLAVLTCSRLIHGEGSETSNQGSGSETKRPHIVFVLADDYGFKDIGYHGSEIKTPHLDELATKGVRLENYYVQCCCTPSRASFMSGRYLTHLGMQYSIIWVGQEHALPDNSPTMADKLREAGYATHMVGKWHLGFYKTRYIPIRRGFDTFYGFYSGGEDYYTHKRSAGGGRPAYLDLHQQDRPVYNETGHYSTHLFTERAIDRIQAHDASKPMFLYLAYQAVHWPMQVPDSYLKPYKHIKEEKRRYYAAMTACMDEGIANLTQALKDKGMWDDTVFVFSTDNGGVAAGGGNNYPLRGQKGSLWDGGIRAVGFVHAKNLQTAGKISKALMHVSDWYPTFVGLAGGSLNGTLPLDGYDQWNAISKDQTSPRTELLHNIEPISSKMGEWTHSGKFDHRTRAALRSGDWKILTGNPGSASWHRAPEFSSEFSTQRKPVWTNYPTQNLWLYNMSADPREEHNLVDERPEIVAMMLRKLAEYNSTAVPAVYPPMYSSASDPGRHTGVWGPWVKEYPEEVLQPYATLRPRGSGVSLRCCVGLMLVSLLAFLF